MEFRSEFWRRIYQLGIVPVEVPNPKIGEKERHDRPPLPHKQSTPHDTVVNYVYSDDVYNTPSLPDSPCELSNNCLQSKAEFSPEAEELRLLLQHDRDDFMRSTARAHAHMTTNLRRMYPTTTHTTASLSRTLHTLRARSSHPMTTDPSGSSSPPLVGTSPETQPRQIIPLPLALGPPAPRLPEDPLPSIRARVYGQAASQSSHRSHPTTTRTPVLHAPRIALGIGSPSPPVPASRAPRTASAICAHFLTLRLPHAEIGVLDSSLLAFTRLQLLSVPHNNIQTLSLLPPALLHLDIAHNALTRIELPRTTGNDAPPRLLTLDVSHNALTRLDGLAALPHLTHLDASHNDVASLRTLLRTLPALPALTHLSLHHNPVALLPAYSLAVLLAAPALRVLDGVPVPRRVSQWAAALRALFARMLRVQHPFEVASPLDTTDRACSSFALLADAPEQSSPPSPSRPLSPAASSSARRGRYRDSEHVDSRASSASASTSSPASRLRDRRKDPSACSSRDGKEGVRSRGSRREKERDRKAPPPEASPAMEPTLLAVGLRQIPPAALPLAALAAELALPPPPTTMPLAAPAPRARKRGQLPTEGASTNAPLSMELFARRHNMRLLAHVARAGLSALVRALFVELRAVADPTLSRSRMLTDAHAAAEAAAKTAFASACVPPTSTPAGCIAPVVVSPPADKPAHVLSFGMSVTQAAPPPCLSLFAREDVGFISSVAWLARRATALALAAPRGILTPSSPTAAPPPAPEPTAPEEPAALPMLALTPALLASMDGSVLPSEVRAREAREQEERDRAALVTGVDARQPDQRGDESSLTLSVPPPLALATGASASSPPASPLPSPSPTSPRAVRSPRARRSSVLRRRSLVLRLAAGDEFASLVVDQRPVHTDTLGTNTAPSWFLHETDALAFRSSCPAAAALRGVASDALADVDTSAPAPPIDCEDAAMPRSLLLRSAPHAAVPSLPVHFAHALTQVVAPEGCSRVPPNRHASHLCSCAAFPGPPHPPHLCSHLRDSAYPPPAEPIDSSAPLAGPLPSNAPEAVSIDSSSAVTASVPPIAADSTRCAAYALEEFHCPPSQLRVCASQHELHPHAFAHARDPSAAPMPAAVCCFGAHTQAGTSALISHTDHAEEIAAPTLPSTLCGPAAHLDAALAGDAARNMRASLLTTSATGPVSASAPMPMPTTPVREARDKTKKPAATSTPGTCVCPNADCAGLIYLAPSAQPKDKATGVAATLAAGTAFGARADVTVTAVAHHASAPMATMDPLQPPASHPNTHTTTMLSQATTPTPTTAPPAAPAAALSQMLPAYEAFLAKQPLRQHSLLASSGSFTLPLAPRAELLALLRDECLLGDSVVTPALPTTERREDPYARGCVSVWWAAEVEYRAQLLVRLPLLGDALLEVRRGPIAEPGVAMQGQDAVINHTLTQGLLSSTAPAPERAAKSKTSGKVSVPAPAATSLTSVCSLAQHTHTATLAPPCSTGSPVVAHAPLRVVSHNADLLHVHAMCAVQPETLVEQLLHPRTNTSAHGYHSLGAARAVRQTNLAPHVCAVVDGQCVRTHAVHLLGSPWVPLKLTVLAEPRFTWRQLRHLATPSMAWLVTRSTRAAITATTFLPHAALHGQQPPSEGSEVAPGSASPQSPTAAPVPFSAPAPLALGPAVGKRRKAPGDLAVCRSERFTHSCTEWRISAPVQFDLLAPPLTSVEPLPAVLADSAQEQERPSTGILLPPVRGASSTTTSGSIVSSSSASSSMEAFVTGATAATPMSSVVDACNEQMCPPNVMLWLLGMICRGHKRYSAHVDNRTFTLSLLDKSPHVRNGSIVGHMFVNCDQPAADAGLTGSYPPKE